MQTRPSSILGYETLTLLFSGALKCGITDILLGHSDQRQALVETGSTELFQSEWLPILNEFDSYGVDVVMNSHPA